MEIPIIKPPQQGHVWYCAGTYYLRKPSSGLKLTVHIL